MGKPEFAQLKCDNQLFRSLLYYSCQVLWHIIPSGEAAVVITNEKNSLWMLDITVDEIWDFLFSLAQVSKVTIWGH